MLYETVGPKLFEENMLYLIDQGYLARPYCVEIRCKLDEQLKLKYQKSDASTRVRLHTGNPTKIRALKYLIEVHEARNDTIIVFCDSVPVLMEVAKYINRPIIHGKLPARERLFIFDRFKKGQVIKTVFLSRVGDTGIDIPAANVAIQIGGQFNSQR